MIKKLIHSFLDWHYTRAVKKYLAHINSKKSWRYFQTVKRRSIRLTSWEGKYNL